MNNSISHLMIRMNNRIAFVFLFLAVFSFQVKSQSITSANPDKGRLGEVLNVFISGQNVDFNASSPTLQANFKQGTVNIPATPVSVDSVGTVLEVSLDLTNAAYPIGQYDVEVSNSTHGLLTLTNGFEIDTIGLRKATPSIGYLGQNFNVFLIGEGVDFTSVTNSPDYIGGNDTISTSIVGIRGTDTLELSLDLSSGNYQIGHYLLSLIIPGDTLYVRNALEIRTTNISGTVFYDFNANGIQDSLETGHSYTRITLKPNNSWVRTNFEGGYSFDNLSFGNYTLIASPPAGGFFTSPDTVAVNINAEGSYNVSFGVNSNSQSTNYSLGFSGLIKSRCADLSTVRIERRNFSWVPINGGFKVTKHPLATFNPQTIAQSDSISGDTAYYSFQLAPHSFLSYYTDVISTLPSVTVLPVGTVIETKLISWRNDSSGAIVPSTYKIETQSSIVKCSFDPNDKAVSPVGQGQDGLVLHGTKLNYHIRFQNTGNDTAYRVVVLDTLSNHLDLSTYQFVGSSHNTNTVLKQNGELSFTFNNINLVDSITNEPLSHGYISFNINPKQALFDSTVVSNTAAIYFDFNPAVITNTVHNMYVTTIVSLKEYETGLKAVIYPNPSNGFVKVQFEEKLKNALVRVYDLQGKVIQTGNNINGAQFDLDFSEHPKGVYFINIIDGENYLNRKVVIQ